ncbi:MAG: histidine kinase dimerization/phosphoacceptor domain -containing protein, partial [Methanobacteriaceae archaeon]|nr:histidine kinase dimerization/phosphoacceptor domain -containing protein [Methanobacteriaceae archaeon]
MYELIHQFKKSGKIKIRFEKKEDLLNIPSIYKTVEKFSLAEIYDQIDYGITVFKYLPEKDDFLTLYSNDSFWDYFTPDFHKKMQGCLLSEIINNKNNENLVKKSLNKKTEGKLKLYENSHLLKIWSFKIINQGDLTYFCIKELTDYYIEKNKEDTIFNNSPFPTLNINKDLKIIKINKSFKNLSGYSSKDFKSLNFDKIAHVINSKKYEGLKLSEILNIAFKNHLVNDNVELVFLTKNNEEKIVNAYITALNKNIIQIYFEDLSQLRKSEKNTKRISKYLSQIQETSKVALNIFKEDYYYWTDAIFDIFEIEIENRVYNSKKLFIYDYVTPKNKKIIDDNLRALTYDNPVTFEFKAITPKGNEKYLKTFIRIIEDNNKFTRISITRDITSEKLVLKESFSLKNTFEAVESASKIFLAEYVKGKFFFTNEIYKLLEVNPEDYEGMNILTEFALPLDKELFNNTWNKVSVDNPGFELNLRLKSKSGEIIYLYLNSIFKFKDDKIFRASTFMIDVTSDILNKKSALDLQKSINNLGNLSKIVVGSHENGKYTWTPEIYNILKINPEDYDDTVNILRFFTVKEDEKAVNELLNGLTVENNSFSHVSKVLDSEGNLHYINGYIVASFDSEGNHVKNDYILQDITEEILIRKEKDQLQNSINAIGSFSKIVVGSYENGKYSWTPEIYNILKINPGDYEDSVNLLREFEFSEGEDLNVYEFIKNSSPENNSFTRIAKVCDSEGNLHYLNSYIVISFDSKGNPDSYYFLLQYITDKILAEKSALDLQYSLDNIQDISKIVISSYKDGKYSWTPEIYNILEISPGDYPIEDMDIIREFTVKQSDDSTNFLEIPFDPETNSNHGQLTIKTVNGNIKYLNDYMKAKYDSDGNLIEIIGFIQDVTEIIDYQKQLESLSDDRKILLQEVHHRVKNNLQLILSFLSLESRFNKDNPEYVVEQTRNRIQTMALTHEEVYQSTNLSSINLEHFI